MSESSEAEAPSGPGERNLRDEVEVESLENIIPYGENPKKHPDEQVDKIASSIRRFGFDQPIVVDAEGTIIKGHGRYQAAKRLGMDEVPIIRAPDLSEAEVRAARIADNRVAESEWDDDLLSVEMELLDEGPLDAPLPELTGFEEDEIDDFFDEEDGLGEDEERYTDKIETPVYEPTGEKPALEDLYDDERAQELLERVEAADIDEDKREFLRYAAYRHIVFDYENIAEYFAHEDGEMQELMEALTLVVVDYNQAVEQGFIDFADEALDGVNRDDR